MELVRLQFPSSINALPIRILSVEGTSINTFKASASHRAIQASHVPRFMVNMCYVLTRQLTHAVVVEE